MSAEFGVEDRLAFLKERYDTALELEKQCRSDLNFLRRELSRLARARKAARIAWEAECERLV
jgi:hypothetical protein